MNQNIDLTYLFILALCLSLAAFGAIVTHMIWSDKYRRDVQETRNSTQRECWAAQKAQQTMQGEQGKQFLEAMEQQNQIALFLREHYQPEIKRGYHSGRGLAEIVTGYLGVERERTNAQSVQHGVSRVGPFSSDLSRQRSEEALAAAERIRQAGAESRQQEPVNE